MDGHNADETSEQIEPIDEDEAFREVRVYGTHLYEVPAAIDLDAVTSFPPGGATRLDDVPSRGLEDEERERELERAAERFARKVDEHDLAPDRRLVVAIGEGQEFQIAPWSTFAETFLEEPERVEAVAVPVEDLEDAIQYLGKLEAAGTIDAREIRKRLERHLESREGV